MPMVSREDFARVQQLLSRSRQRKTHHRARSEFPLRGSARCKSCQRYLTSSFSRGRAKRYPYYFCYQRQCAGHRTSVPAEAVHQEFEHYLRNIAVKRELIASVGETVQRVAAERRVSVQTQKARRKAELEKTHRQTQELIQMRTRGLITDQEFVMQKAALSERRFALEGAVSSNDGSVGQPVEEQLQAIIEPLTNLQRTWRSLPDALQPRFVRLLLPVGFVYGRIGTAELGLLFRVFGGSGNSESSVVGPPGLEPGT